MADDRVGIEFVTKEYTGVVLYDKQDTNATMHTVAVVIVVVALFCIIVVLIAAFVAAVVVVASCRFKDLLRRCLSRICLVFLSLVVIDNFLLLLPIIGIDSIVWVLAVLYSSYSYIVSYNNTDTN